MGWCGILFMNVCIFPCARFLRQAISRFGADSACAQCPNGRYSEADKAQTECTACPVGKFLNYARQHDKCQQCPDGTVTETVAAAECVSCSEGKYHEIGTNECINCAGGRFQNENGKFWQREWADWVTVFARLCLVSCAIELHFVFFMAVSVLVWVSEYVCECVSTCVGVWVCVWVCGALLKRRGVLWHVCLSH